MSDRNLIYALAVIALAVLVFVGMCLDAEGYPSSAVWLSLAIALYAIVVCMITVFRSLVDDIRTAPAKTLNLVHLVFLSWARYSTAFRRAFVWIVPSFAPCLPSASFLHYVASQGKWHPSTHPQLE